MISDMDLEVALDLAKQRASVLWLLSKAYNNEIPSDLKEPFYTDMDENDKLKPQIIQALASAELYCLALANIYSDPNYHCLNHYGIMQILQRKGVYMVEPNDVSLTETVLIQNAPIKMSAHMVIIEAIMTLYIKEVLIPEKVAEVVARFSYLEDDEIPEDLEEVAIFWINKCCVALKQVIQKEMNENESTRNEPTPPLPMLEELTDLSDGTCLAALLSFYCPEHLHWQEICLNKDMSLADSIYNLQLVQFFCEEKLPFNCCHLSLEDFLYLHETIQTNVLAFVADLLFLFEIRPADCVQQPAMDFDDGSVESDVHHRLCYPDLPTPAEMKAKSLQHSSWVDEHQVLDQTNGSSPTRTPRRTNSSAKLANRQKSTSSSQHQSDEDEELTRYFSAIDLKTENELSPEIMMITERHKTPLKTGPKSINSFSNSNNNNNIRRNSVKDLESNYKSSCDQNDVILSTSPLKQSDNNISNESNNKSSSQLADYFTQLAQTNSSATTTRRTSAPNARTPAKVIKQNLMNSSIVLGTDSPPLPPCALNTSKTSFGKLNSKTAPLSPDQEPAINIAYLNKSDKSSLNSSTNCLPTTQTTQTTQSNPTLTPVTTPNTSNTNTFKVNSSQNSLKNLPIGGDQPFYLQDNDNSPNGGQRPNAMSFNSRSNLSQISKSDSIDSLLEDNENNTSRDSVDNEIASQVYNIRMKLEEKRRKIELERLSAEEEWKSSRQNIGKEAFLRVVHKNGNQGMPEVLPDYQSMAPQMAPQMMPNHSNHCMTANNHLMNNRHMMNAPAVMNPALVNNQMMNQPELIGHQYVNHQMMTGPQVMPHQMVNQNANSFYINSQPNVSNMSGVSIPNQQVYEEYERQQQMFSQSSSPTSKPIIGRTFRVIKPKVMSPEVSEHNSPTRSVFSEYSDEGFNNYEKSNKSSSSGSTKEGSTAGDNYPKESFFISFGNESKPKAVKPGLKPKQVKQMHNMRRELKSQLEQHIPPQEHPYNNNTNSSQDSTQYTNGGPTQAEATNLSSLPSPGVGFVIGADLVHPDPTSEVEMAKKKETIMLQSLKRRERLEAERLKKEQSLAQKREDERLRRESSERKKEEERIKRQLILEQYRHRKAAEEAEKNGSVSSKDSVRSSSTLVLNRPSRQRLFQKPRPKSLHVSASSIQDYSSLDCNKSRIVDDTDACLMSSASRPESAMSGQSKASAYVSSPTSHASNVPPFMYSRFRGPPSDGASDAGSIFTEYTGPKLFVKPSQKSNKVLILNAINVVLAGAVNQDIKKKVLEHINTSDSKHFLILFRNAGLQFRAVYTYNADREEVFKLFGTGPKTVSNEVIERFYKYNSGSKSFAEIQTKHLSVTIDAFIIHNNLWTGKRVIPKKDYL